MISPAGNIPRYAAECKLAKSPIDFQSFHPIRLAIAASPFGSVHDERVSEEAMVLNWPETPFGKSYCRSRNGVPILHFSIHFRRDSYFKAAGP